MSEIFSFLLREISKVYTSLKCIYEKLPKRKEKFIKVRN